MGATAGLLGPGRLDDPKLAGLGAAIMVGVAFGAWLFMFTDRKLGRTEAIVLLAVYATAVPLLA